MPGDRRFGLPIHMQLQAILFDLGDTLFDFQPMDTRAVFEQAGRGTYEYLQTRGHKLPPFKRYFRKQYSAVRWAYFWSKISRRDFNGFDLLCRLCRKMDLRLDQRSLRELAWQWYEPVTRYNTVADDVVPTLRKLRDRGLKLAIVSNTFIPGFSLDRHLDMHGLLEFFPVRIYSSEVGYRKPHPRIFQIALNALGVSPAHAIFVGDLVKTDIVGARRAGMVTVLRHPFANSRTHHVADHVVRKISEIHQMLPILGAPEPEPAPIAEHELACEA